VQFSHTIRQRNSYTTVRKTGNIWICRGVATGIVVVTEVGAIETRLAGSSSDSWRYSTAEDAMRGSTENWPN
jgi:hypothetical protein